MYSPPTRRELAQQGRHVRSRIKNVGSRLVPSATTARRVLAPAALLSYACLTLFEVRDLRDRARRR